MERLCDAELDKHLSLRRVLTGRPSSTSRPRLEPLLPDPVRRKKENRQVIDEEEEEEEGNEEGEDEPEEVIRNIHYQHPRKCIIKYVNVGGRGKEGKQMTKPSEKQKLKEISNGPEFRRHS